VEGGNGSVRALLVKFPGDSPFAGKPNQISDERRQARGNSRVRRALSDVTEEAGKFVYGIVRAIPQVVAGMPDLWDYSV
jgi:hypothetical protein